MNLCQKMAILNELVDVAKRRRNELKFFLVVVLYICMVDLNVQGGGRIKSTPYGVHSKHGFETLPRAAANLV